MRYLDLNDPEDFATGARMVPEIKRALPYTGGLYTYEDVGRRILEGQMQLWVHEDSVAVTELEVYPTALVCHIFLGAGTLCTILELLAAIEVWAADVGCAKIAVSGRKGWVRQLKPSGYNETSVTVTKEL
jgi:hypothetical protein